MVRSPLKIPHVNLTQRHSSCLKTRIQVWSLLCGCLSNADPGFTDFYYFSGAYLRQSQARMNIHRSKKLTGIAKKKDDICKHLESGNEVNAKIWAETLINEENMIPVYDVVSTMCD